MQATDSRSPGVPFDSPVRTRTSDPSVDVPDLRHADAPALRASFDALRQRRQRLWAAYAAALGPSMTVRHAPELNPPRWELGHIAWFEDFWIARNPHRLAGHRADPTVPRAAARPPTADALYDSSKVAHTRRWHLDLPDARRTWEQADAVRERTLALLPGLDGDDDTLYFPRLAAIHEAMHLEAWVYMAQNLALDLRDTGLRLQPARARPAEELSIAAGSCRVGHSGPGFAFDNEVPALDQALDAFRIDAAPVTWGRYLPFVEAGGYDEARWWSDDGWAWRRKHSNGRPLHVTPQDGAWQRAVFGQWTPLDLDEPAVHLNLHEAQAWCRWAGRRLPTEHEWEHAATAGPAAFEWGEVWEWTASPFAPYPGFEPHPYRDYSQPWFDGRPVLRGASFATWPGLRHAVYRNFFPAHRQDILAGFRSCAA
jgi:ergothioneine biosynthesis protein EgtB